MNFTKKEFRVEHTVTRGTQINRLNITKTNCSNRTFPLNDDQIAILMKLKEQEESNKAEFGTSYHEDDYIFNKYKDGTLRYPDYPSKAFRKVIKNNKDLPQSITFHGLRKSCASLLVHQGFDIKSIQEWMGHAEVETTLKIYAKVKEKEAKIEILNGMTQLIPAKPNNKGKE